MSPATHQATQEPQTAGTVLFMDDEELLQELISAMLDILGYEVVRAGDGREAIMQYRHAQTAGRPFAVVMVDLNIPGGMGGRETATKRRELDPHVRLIASSGDSSDPLLAEYGQYGFSGAIAKPYQMADLKRVLRRVISLPAATLA